MSTNVIKFWSFALTFHVRNLECPPRLLSIDTWTTMTIATGQNLTVSLLAALVIKYIVINSPNSNTNG